MKYNDILVSIVCNTYNHEKFIADALEGFIKQKTNFMFEILVMDDASTDKTALIIMEYEKKYPQLIKAIYQTENQYSKGLRPGQQNRERAKGKYIAICEGDDYWIDDRKLQKQVDYMESHPDCTFCFTNAKCEINGEIVRNVIPWTKESIVLQNNIYDVEGIEKIGYIPTASFLVKSENYARLPIIRPTAFHGDGFLKVGMTALGYAYCINEATCVYRFMVSNSATTKWHDNTTEYIRSANRFIEMYEDLYTYFNKEYYIFKARALEWEASKAIKCKDYKALRKKEYKHLYKSKGKKMYLKYVVISRFPFLYELIRGTHHERK